jgi:hypothetical protein
VLVLPRELMTWIFRIILKPRILCRWMLVSRRWRKFLEENVTDIPLFYPFAAIGKFFKLFPKLSSLPEVDSNKMLAHYRPWKYLQQLKINFINEEDTDSTCEILEEVPSSWSELASVYLSCVMAFPDRLQQWLESLPKLSHLFIDSQDQLDVNLQHCTQLTSLDLQYCHVRNTKYLSQFTALANMGLWISENQNTLPILTSLKILSLQFSNKDVSFDYNCLTKLLNLEKLFLSRAPAPLHFIDQLTKLTSLAIEKIDLKNISSVHIYLPYLQKLHIGSTKGSLRLFPEFALMTTLSKLSLANNFETQVIEVIRKLSNLKSLRFHHSDTLLSSHFSSIFPDCFQLKKLSISLCPSVTHQVIPLLAKGDLREFKIFHQDGVGTGISSLTSLEKLEVSQTMEFEWHEISNLGSISKLAVPPTAIPYIYFNSLSRLSELKITSCRDDQIELLDQSLQGNQHIELLNLEAWQGVVFQRSSLKTFFRRHPNIEVKLHQSASFK